MGFKFNLRYELANLVESDLGARMTKDEIRRETDAILEELPDELSWDDLMYGIYARQKIENGVADKEAGRVHSHADLERHFDRKA